MKRSSEWIANMCLINLIELSSEGARGLTLSTLYLYVLQLGGGVKDLSWIISVFSVGRLISSTLFGQLSDILSMRQTYIISLLISLFGNILYVFADSSHIVGAYGLTALVFSRCVVGFGAGNRAVCRANVAQLCRPESRMRYMTVLQAMVYFAYAVTPGIASLFPYQQQREFWTLGGVVNVNIYTVPGIVLCALNFLVLCCILLIFDETIDEDDEPGKHDVVVNASQNNLKNTTARLDDHTARIGFVLFLSMNFLLKGTLSIFETFTPVMFLDVTDQVHKSSSSTPRGQQIASFLFWLGVGGLIVLLLVASQKSNQKRSDTLCWTGFFVQGIGCATGAILSVHPSMAVLVVTEVLVWSVASPVAGAVLISSFSCMLGSAKQGLSMGLIGSAGSLGRIIAPPLNGILMESGHESLIFLLCSVWSFLGAGALYAYRRFAEREGRRNEELQPILREAKSP